MVLGANSSILSNLIYLHWHAMTSRREVADISFVHILINDHINSPY